MKTERSGPNLAELFTDFLWVGMQSFGGGSSTFILIHKLAIERRWLTEEEFVRAWALAQIAPGINLVKLTVMIGYRLRQWPGVLATMGGLLLPSALVTILMTAGYSTIRDLAWVKGMTRGILPAAIGLSLAMSTQMAQPLLLHAHREGPTRLATHLLILLTAALLFGMAHLSPVVVLLSSGLVTILMFFLIPVRSSG